MYFSLGSPGLWDSSSHIDILTALERRDPAEAEAAMARDIMKTGISLMNNQERASGRPEAELSSDMRGGQIEACASTWITRYEMPCVTLAVAAP